MSDEQPFYAPNRTPDPPRASKPGEPLFEFSSGGDRFRCELRDHGEFGIEAQFYRNGEFWISRRFDDRVDPTRTPRALAIAWAEEERRAMEAGS